MSNEQGERFDMWGIAEVMGHRRFAGHITEQTLAGSALVRVDVPEVVVQIGWGPPPQFKTAPAYSKLIGVGSIYCITPTTEDVARRAAAELAKYEGDPIPVSLPVDRQIPASVVTEAEVDDEDDLPY
jgi:hypothetical protein